MTVQVGRDMERAFGQLYEIQKRLLNGALSPVAVRQPLQDIVEGKFAIGPVIFSNPQEIFDRFVGYANEQNWPFFGTDQLKELIQQMPVDHSSSLDRLLTLDIWLGDLPATFQALAGWIAYEQSRIGNGFWYWDGLRSDPEHLRLLDSKHYGDKPSVRWVELDMMANRGSAPKDVRDPKSSAGLQVMTAFAIHPAYPPAIDYEIIPGAWAAGLQATVPDSEAWSDVPLLYWRRGDRRVGLSAFWDDDRDSGDAVPVSREL